MPPRTVEAGAPIPRTQPLPPSSGDQYIDYLRAQGYNPFLTPNGDLVYTIPGERGNPAQSIRIPNYTLESGSGSSGRLSTDDPRYWELQYAQLNSNEKIAFAQIQATLINAGLDANSARQQALASLISNRNSNAVNLAQTSGNIAAQAAEFAANPRSAVAEQMFSNAAFGNQGTPFGSAFTDPNFPAYQTALQDQFQKLFGGVSGDLAKARDFVSSIPPQEYLAPVGTPAMPVAGATGQDIANSGFTSPNVPSAAPRAAGGVPNIAAGLQALPPGALTPPPKLDLSGLKGLAQGGMVSFNPEDKGYTPSSAEGGMNMNIFEPSFIVGADSGHIYAKLAEPRPDGKRRGEQVKITPLPSEKEKDKRYEAKNQSPVAEKFPSVSGFAHGGSANVTDASDLINSVNIGLRQAGGFHGGVGIGEPGVKEGPLPNLRLLAGAPANYLEDNPDFLDRALSAYSSFGISPRNFASTIRAFTPRSPINNFPRVAYA